MHASAQFAEELSGQSDDGDDDADDDDNGDEKKMPRLVPEKIYDAMLGCLSMHSAILLEQDRSTTLMIMIMKGS